MKKIKLLFFFTIFLVACQPSDEQKIIGIWQNEADWFNIKKDNKYDTGTGPATAYTDLQYIVDTKLHELNFYTSNVGKSFYMNYRFIGNDTLEMKNKLGNPHWIKFYRANKLPSTFN